MTILFSRKECNQIARSIENDVRKRWGWVIKFSVSQEGDFSWTKVSGKDRYDMYPSLTKEQADAVVMDEIREIINRHMPNSRLTDYYQSGAMHYPTR